MQPIIIQDKMQNQFFGSVSVRYRNKKDGTSTEIHHKNNLITYGGADILAALLSGDERKKVSHMYFKYKNTTGTPVVDSISRSSSVGDFLSLDGSDGTDWLKVPIMASPLLDNTSEESYSRYKHNRVTFVGTTSAVAPVGLSKDTTPNAFGHSVSSKIYSLALVASPSRQTNSDDILFARTNIAPIVAVEDSYIDVFWTLTFL